MQTKVTAYNILGTKQSRVVASYTDEGASLVDIIKLATVRASVWNKTETRPDMLVNFVVAGGMVRTV